MVTDRSGLNRVVGRFEQTILKAKLCLKYQTITDLDLDSDLHGSDECSMAKDERHCEDALSVVAVDEVAVAVEAVTSTSSDPKRTATGFQTRISLESAVVTEPSDPASVVTGEAAKTFST